MGGVGLGLSAFVLQKEGGVVLSRPACHFNRGLCERRTRLLTL